MQRKVLETWSGLRPAATRAPSARVAVRTLSDSGEPCLQLAAPAPGARYAARRVSSRGSACASGDWTSLFSRHFSVCGSRLLVGLAWGSGYPVRRAYTIRVPGRAPAVRATARLSRGLGCPLAPAASARRAPPEKCLCEGTACIVGYTNKSRDNNLNRTKHLTNTRSDAPSSAHRSKRKRAVASRRQYSDTPRQSSSSACP